MTDTGETMGLREVVARIRDAAQAALLTPATPTDVGTYLIPLTPENVDYIGAVAPARVLNILDDFAAQQARVAELEAERAHDLRTIRRLIAADDAVPAFAPAGSELDELNFAWADVKARFRENTDGT